MEKSLVCSWILPLTENCDIIWDGFIKDMTFASTPLLNISYIRSQQAEKFLNNQMSTDAPLSKHSPRLPRYWKQILDQILFGIRKHGNNNAEDRKCGFLHLGA